MLLSVVLFFSKRTEVRMNVETTPRIAVIDRNTLAAVGLKSLIRTMAPSIEIDIFGTVADLQAKEKQSVFYLHYFAAQDVVTANSDFFHSRQRKTIVMATSQETPTILDSFHFLHVNVDEESLIAEIQTMMKSNHCVHQAEPAKLSVREIEVLTLIVKGYINKEIADRLNLSLSTIITHRRNITEKLNRKSVGALTVYAVTHGLVTMEEI